MLDMIDYQIEQAKARRAANVHAVNGADDIPAERLTPEAIADGMARARARRSALVAEQRRLRAFPRS